MFDLQPQKNLFRHLLPLHFLPSTGCGVQSCITQLLLPLAWSPQLLWSLTDTTFRRGLDLKASHRSKFTGTGRVCFRKDSACYTEKWRDGLALSRCPNPIPWRAFPHLQMQSLWGSPQTPTRSLWQWVTSHLHPSVYGTDSVATSTSEISFDT